MRDLQAKQLEILKCFIRICEKLNISYFLVCGSALGAVKYQGFIPWDDDIDIGMFRKDYDRFLKEAPAFLPPHLFLQSFRTDPEYPQIFSKLRDSETTFIEKSVSHLSINHGVYIDIFPLDGYPKRKLSQALLECRKWIYEHQLATAYNIRYGFWARAVCLINKLLKYHKRTASVLEKYEKLISKYDTETSAIICNHGNWQGKLEYADKSQYGNGTCVTFEGLRVRIPDHYHEYLTQKYGDYMSDLPPEKQVGHHYYEVCDLNRPYTDYLRKQ